MTTNLILKEALEAAKLLGQKTIAGSAHADYAYLDKIDRAMKLIEAEQPVGYGVLDPDREIVAFRRDSDAAHAFINNSLLESSEMYDPTAAIWVVRPVYLAPQENTVGLVTRNQFELAFRRYMDEGGHAYDPFIIEAEWQVFQQDPESFGYLLSYMVEGK